MICNTPSTCESWVDYHSDKVPGQIHGEFELRDEKRAYFQSHEHLSRALVGKSKGRCVQ